MAQHAQGDNRMIYVARSTEQGAAELVAELIAAGNQAYWIKVDADTWQVRYWK
jgi:hypothetical protein